MTVFTAFFVGRCAAASYVAAAVLVFAAGCAFLVAAGWLFVRARVKLGG